MVQFWNGSVHRLCWFDSRFHEHRKPTDIPARWLKCFFLEREIRTLLFFCGCSRCFCFNVLPWYISMKPPFGRIILHFLTTSSKTKHQPPQKGHRFYGELTVAASHCDLDMLAQLEDSVQKERVLLELDT